MALMKAIPIARNVMYLTMFMIGLSLFGIGIMYLVQGRSVEATYFIVAFIIAEVLALSLKYCKCCYFCCYGGSAGSDNNEFDDENEYSVLINETLEQQRLKQEIYNNEPYSALLPKSYQKPTKYYHPKAQYDSIVSTTTDFTNSDDKTRKSFVESLLMTSASGILRDSLDSQQSFDSKFNNEEFPVLQPDSPAFVDIDSEAFYYSVDNYSYNDGDIKHKNASRYNSFQSNSLPADFRASDQLEGSFRSFDTAASNVATAGREESV